MRRPREISTFRARGWCCPALPRAEPNTVAIAKGAVSTVLNSSRIDTSRLLNSVEKPEASRRRAAARLLRTAIRQSGLLQKELGQDKAQFTRQLDGLEKLWFHAMLDWPAEIWLPLLALIAEYKGLLIERQTVLRTASKDWQIVLRDVGNK